MLHRNINHQTYVTEGVVLLSENVNLMVAQDKNSEEQSCYIHPEGDINVCTAVEIHPYELCHKHSLKYQVYHAEFL